MSTEEEQALSQLSLGHTDEVGAMRLGMSLRTFRRRVHEAMGKLGAQSRFQAGMAYARWKNEMCITTTTDR